MTRWRLRAMVTFAEGSLFNRDVVMSFAKAEMLPSTFLIKIRWRVPPFLISVYTGREPRELRATWYSSDAVDLHGRIEFELKGV